MNVGQAPLPNPYVGPRSFQAGEALYGRDHEIRDLLGLLIAERIVLLHSPSGAGKTSLVQAALIPQLEERRVHDSAGDARQPRAAAPDDTTNDELTDGTLDWRIRPSPCVLGRQSLCPERAALARRSAAA